MTSTASLASFLASGKKPEPFDCDKMIGTPQVALTAAGSIPLIPYSDLGRGLHVCPHSPFPPVIRPVSAAQVSGFGPDMSSAYLVSLCTILGTCANLALPSARAQPWVSTITADQSLQRDVLKWPMIRPSSAPATWALRYKALLPVLQLCSTPSAKCAQGLLLLGALPPTLAKSSCVQLT